MPFIRVRALKKFEIGEHQLKEGELFYLPPADARRLQGEGKVEMILSRYPERLEGPMLDNMGISSHDVNERIQELMEDEPPGWTRKEPCDCPDKKKEATEDAISEIDIQQ